MATTGYSDLKEFQRVEVVVSPYRAGPTRRPPAEAGHRADRLDPSRAHGRCPYSGGMSTVAEPSTDLPAPTASYAVDPALVRRLTRRVVCAARPELRTTSSPLTGGPVAELPLSTADDVALAYAAATAAQRRWAALPVRRRGEILLRLHDLVLDHQEQLLDLVQLESGKARSHAFEEVADVAIVCRHYARVAANHLARGPPSASCPGCRGPGRHTCRWGWWASSRRGTTRSPSR